jgi:hypothetical protein
MTASHIDDPAYYRNWAEEIRTLSGAMKNIETKAQMARLALDYEKLAERAAQRANGEPLGDIQLVRPTGTE